MMGAMDITETGAEPEDPMECLPDRDDDGFGDWDEDDFEFVPRC